MSRDQVGELLNPNAIKTKFHKRTNHIQKNNQLIKILATARTNKELQQAEEKRKEKEKGYFQMPRFIATPSKKLVPDVLSRDQQRKEYKIVRDCEIEENNKALAAGNASSPQPRRVVMVAAFTRRRCLQASRHHRCLTLHTTCAPVLI